MPQAEQQGLQFRSRPRSAMHCHNVPTDRSEDDHDPNGNQIPRCGEYVLRAAGGFDDGVLNPEKKTEHFQFAKGDDTDRESHEAWPVFGGDLHGEVEG